MSVLVWIRKAMRWKIMMYFSKGQTSKGVYTLIIQLGGGFEHKFFKQGYTYNDLNTKVIGPSIYQRNLYIR